MPTHTSSGGIPRATLHPARRFTSAVRRLFDAFGFI